MLDWERAALHLSQGDVPRALYSLSAMFDPTRGTSHSAWWVTAFYGPDVWRRWHVGLLHGSLNLWLEEAVELPGVAAAALPAEIRAMASQNVQLAKWQQARITPVVVAGEALGFVIRPVPPPTPNFLEVFAPTQLTTRLGLGEKSTAVAVDILPAGY